ncbi:hypothetical protein B0J11DRAFT_532128 [Dendryphion nanum]|uniref:Uncharacterized protein n=1 Tax=Dendryphion nanum TaxID=256645 RepID=A0A9P9IHX4_9PLEO|nr:hypothetical protein B0J11DRAFT_532128 [Dendryphion nanum]
MAVQHHDSFHGFITPHIILPHRDISPHFFCHFHLLHNFEISRVGAGIYMILLLLLLSSYVMLMLRVCHEHATNTGQCPHVALTGTSIERPRIGYSSFCSSRTEPDLSTQSGRCLETATPPAGHSGACCWSLESGSYVLATLRITPAHEMTSFSDLSVSSI